jgi:acyl-coenzyme A synthetase/AMP-(fatty) acid ligase
MGAKNYIKDEIKLDIACSAKFLRFMLENIVEWQSRLVPEAPAIQTDDGVISYGALARDVAVMTTALAQEDLPPGVVVIGLTHPALQWLFTLALERLGHPTVCELQALEQTAKLVGASTVVTTEAGVRVEGVRILQVTPAWRERAFAHPPGKRRARAKPDDVVRIVLSSGTTGERKAAPITRIVMDMRLGRPVTGAPPFGLRAMPSMGMDTIGGFTAPLMAWLHGGVLIMPRQMDETALRTFKPTSMASSPAQLQGYLPIFKELYSQDEPLNIIVGGGAIPPRLIKQVSDHPGIEMGIGYGATEAGTVASGPAELTQRHPGAVGYLAPWIELEVLDDDGRPSPPGRSGVIRIRGPGVIEGYVGAEPFEDGWFYPNDVGRVEADGLLVIDGRVDDVVNVGGVKLSATRIEETLAACEGVEDAAVVAFPTMDGRWVIQAAIVSSDGYRPEDLHRAVLAAHRTPISLWEVEKIPRNAMGKIIRAEARQAILERAGRTTQNNAPRLSADGQGERP